MITGSRMHGDSIEYHLATAATAGESWQSKQARQTGGGGWAEYYTEHGRRDAVAVVVAAPGRDKAALEGLLGLRDGESVEHGAIRDWFGEGVLPSGLEGRAFQADRVHPKTGKVYRAIHGMDWVIAMPKELSIMWAVTEHEYVRQVIMEAMHKGAETSNAYFAEHAAYTRVTNRDDKEKKDITRLAGIGMVRFLHYTSRAGDMHLHFHQTIPSKQVTSDGQVYGLDWTSFYHESKAAGMLFQAVVRDHTHKMLGLEWRDVDPDTGMAKLAGFSDGLVQAFSRRQTQLDDWAKENQPTTLDREALDEAEDVEAFSKDRRVAKAKWTSVAQKATRPVKPEEKSFDELVAEWKARPEAAMYRDDRVLGRLDPKAREAGEPSVDAVLEQLRAEHEQWRRADVFEAVAGLWGPGMMEPGERLARMEAKTEEVLSHCYQAAENRRSYEREGHVLRTDELTRQRSEDILRLWSKREERLALRTDDWFVQEARKRRERDGKGLSEEQAAALVALAESPWHVNVLEAAAGTGKTDGVLLSLKERAYEDGRRVLFITPQRSLVAEVREKGLFSAADTVAAELQRIRRGSHQWDARTLVVVDEAGMTGNGDVHELMRAAVDAKAKLFLVGDSHQLQPVKTAGGLFKHLSEQMPWTVELTQVWRQKDPEERAATLTLRDSWDHTAIDSAVDFYLGRGRLRGGDSRTMADMALAEYNKHTAAGRDVVLMCDQHKVSDALNQRIQTQYHHLLGRSPDDASVALNHQLRAYLGDVILTRKNDANIEVTLGGRSTLDEERDKSLEVTNADRWTVVGVWDDGSASCVRTRDGAEARLPAEYLKKNALLGWAATIHSKQGVTADIGIAVLHAETAKRWQLYPGATRGRLANYLFVVDAEAGERAHEHKAHDPNPEPVVLGPREAGGLLKQIVLNDERQRTLADVAEEAVRAAVGGKGGREADAALRESGIAPELSLLVFHQHMVREHAAKLHAEDLRIRQERVAREKTARERAAERRRGRGRDTGRGRDDGPEMSM